MEQSICIKCEKKKYLIEFVVLQYGVVLDTCKLCYKPDLDKERKAIQKELKRRSRAKKRSVLLQKS